MDTGPRPPRRLSGDEPAVDTRVRMSASLLSVPVGTSSEEQLLHRTPHPRLVIDPP